MSPQQHSAFDSRNLPDESERESTPLQDNTAHSSSVPVEGLLRPGAGKLVEAGNGNCGGDRGIEAKRVRNSEGVGDDPRKIISGTRQFSPQGARHVNLKGSIDHQAHEVLQDQHINRSVSWKAEEAKEREPAPSAAIVTAQQGKRVHQNPWLPPPADDSAAPSAIVRSAAPGSHYRMLASNITVRSCGPPTTAKMWRGYVSRRKSKTYGFTRETGNDDNGNPPVLKLLPGLPGVDTHQRPAFHLGELHEKMRKDRQVGSTGFLFKAGL